MEFARLFEEIADLSRILHELPASAVERRFELQAQLDALKQEARLVAAGLPSTRSALEREIQQLRRVISNIDATKVNIAGNAGGSPGGDFGFTKDAMDINAAIDRNSGRAGLMARLRDAEAKLARLEQG